MIKGDRVIAKERIEDPDWKGRGIVVVGSKGTILEKRHKRCFAVKWDNGVTTWKVIPESIDYSKSDRPLEKNPEHVIRRDFWKIYEGSALSNEEIFEPGEKRDCFGNAKRWASRFDDGNTFVVHGKITNVEGKTFDHAWVEQDGVVVDPTQGVKMEKDKWYRNLKAVVEAKYTPYQTMINIVRSGKMGPWFAHEVQDRYVWRRDKGNNPKKSIEESLPGFVGSNPTPKDVFTKQEEQQTLQFIRDLIFRSYGSRSQNLRRVPDKSNAPNCIRWATKIHDPEGEFNFRAVKIDGKIQVQDDASRDKYWFSITDPSSMTLREGLGKKYSKMTKMEEHEALQIVTGAMNRKGNLGKHFKKIGEVNKALSIYPGRDLRTDFRYFEYIAYDGNKKILVIRKRADGMAYGIFPPNQIDLPSKNAPVLKYPFQSWQKFFPLSTLLKESKHSNYTISRKEEQEAIHGIVQRHPMFKLPEAKRNLKKISHITSGDGQYEDVVYQTQYGDVTAFIALNNTKEGMVYQIRLHERNGDKVFINRQPWDYVNPNRAQLKVGELIYESTDAPGYHGQTGAGAIILAKDTGRILLPYRSDQVLQPHTWGTWGGAINEGENPSEALKRELTEELGGDIKIDELIPLYVYRDLKAGFEFHNYLVIVPQEFTPKLDWETDKAEWVKYGVWPRPIHFGLQILLDRSDEIIKSEVKKYMKDPALIKTRKMDRIKFKAAYNLIQKVWGSMSSHGSLENPKDKFDYNDLTQWLLNEVETQELLDYYGHQFYPFDHEPSYTFLEDVEKALEELELRYNRKLSRYVDPTDPLYILKRLVKNKSWEKAKYDLAKFSLSGPIVSKRSISDEEAEEIFVRLFLNAMGETFYIPSQMQNTPRLDTVDKTTATSEYIKDCLQHYLPKGMTKFPEKVKVYRGTNSPMSKIRPGDFCSFDRDFARAFIRGKYGAVARDLIPSHDLLLYKIDRNTSELIYWPEGHQIQKYSGQIPKFKDFFLQNR